MPGGSTTAPSPRWFRSRIGDEAEYSMLLGTISFGRMHLRVEARDTIRDTPAYRLTMEMKGGVPFYRVDDRTVSWLATAPYRSLRFQEVLKQGGYRRHSRWELDHENLTATREDWDEEEGAYRPHRRQRDLPIPSGALDEISYLFLIRALPLEVGRSYEFNRHFEGGRESGHRPGPPARAGPRTRGHVRDDRRAADHPDRRAVRGRRGKRRSSFPTTTAASSCRSRAACGGARSTCTCASLRQGPRKRITEVPCGLPAVSLSTPNLPRLDWKAA